MSTVETPEYSSIETTLLSVPLPEETRTYKPVPHKLLIDEVRSTIETAGHTIKTRNYGLSAEGQIFSTIYSVITPSDDPYEKVVMFQNSYNKVWAVKIAFGTIIDGIIMIDSELTFRKKHMGDVVSQIKELCDLAVIYLSEPTTDVLYKKSMLEAIKVNEDFCSSIFGEMVVKTDIFNTAETTKIKNAIRNYFKDDKMPPHISLWHFYKEVELVVRKSNPTYRIKNYISCINYFTQKFNLS